MHGSDIKADFRHGFFCQIDFFNQIAYTFLAREADYDAFQKGISTIYSFPRNTMKIDD